MARMRVGVVEPVKALLWRFWTAAWEGTRAAGPVGLAAIVCLGIGVAVLVLAEQRLVRLKALGPSDTVVLPAREGAAPALDDAARYALFQSYLYPADAVPDVLKDLMSVADESGIVLSAGEYRREAEPVGGYLRYRISLPVVGEPDAVINFMLGAVRQQKSLALESANFHRERRDSRRVEARIQFVLLTRLPTDTAVTADERR